MKGLACILLALLLASCSVVHVHVTEGDDYRIGPWPMGVRITPMEGAKRGIRVQSHTIGIASGCGAAGLGVTSIDCIQIDPDVCGLAIYEDNGDNSALREAADKTIYHCTKGE